MSETLLNQNLFKADSLVVMTLNKQLKNLLKDKDVTIAQLARATTISAKTLYQWLNGQSPKNLLQVRKVADYFEVTIDYLAFGIIHYSRFWATTLLILTLVSGFFRVAGGVHYPTDILAGIVIGLVIPTIIDSLRRSRLRRR